MKIYRTVYLTISSRFYTSNRLYSLCHVSLNLLSWWCLALFLPQGSHNCCVQCILPSLFVLLTPADASGSVKAALMQSETAPGAALGLRLKGSRQRLLRLPFATLQLEQTLGSVRARRVFSPFSLPTYFMTNWISYFLHMIRTQQQCGKVSKSMNPSTSKMTTLYMRSMVVCYQPFESVMKTGDIPPAKTDWGILEINLWENTNYLL